MASTMPSAELPPTRKEDKKVSRLVGIAVVGVLMLQGLHMIPTWRLDKPYPHIIDYTPFIVPLTAFALWLVLKRTVGAAVVLIFGVWLTYSFVIDWVAGLVNAPK